MKTVANGRVRLLAGAMCCVLAQGAQAWDNGKLLIWINGDKGYRGLQKVGDDFTRKTGIPVKVEHPDDATGKFTQFGGTRQGMVMSWPDRIKDKGGIRNQFSHFIDVVPTILEAADVPAPKFAYGIEQKPIDGTSMAYTWDAKPDDPTRHKIQYFEMFGNRGIYDDGWYANTTPIVDPWALFSVPPVDVMDSYKWELYDLTKDWTQNNDLAAQMPDKLKELQELFIAEAAKNQVFPLDNSVATRMVTPRPSVVAGRSHFEYTFPVVGNPNGTQPNLLAASYKLKAEIEVGEDGGDGMLFTQGGRFGGHGFYILKGKPVYVWNLLDLERVRWEAPQPLTAGKHVIEFDLDYSGLGFATFAFNSLSGVGQPAEGVLLVDGKEVARQKLRSGPRIGEGGLEPLHLDLGKLVGKTRSLCGNIKAALAAVLVSRALDNEVLVDELLQNARESLLGDLQDFEKLSNLQSRVAVNKMQDTMVGASEAILFQDGIGIAGEIAVGEIEELDAGNEVQWRGRALRFTRCTRLQALDPVTAVRHVLGRYVSHVDLLALIVWRFKSNCWA